MEEELWKRRFQSPIPSSSRARALGFGMLDLHPRHLHRRDAGVPIFIWYHPVLPRQSQYDAASPSVVTLQDCVPPGINGEAAP